MISRQGRAGIHTRMMSFIGFGLTSTIKMPPVTIGLLRVNETSNLGVPEAAWRLDFLPIPLKTSDSRLQL